MRKRKVAYTARPRVTPPQAMNCLFDKIGGMSLERPGPATAEGMADFP